jgi:hypothetical protein
VHWHGYDVVMLVAYPVLLVNCGMFLAFGRSFPGTLRPRPGVRLRAWAGICVGAASVGISLFDVTTNMDSGSRLTGAAASLQSPVISVCLLLLGAFFVLMGLAVRAYIKGPQADQAGGGTANGMSPTVGRHARD